MSARLLSPLTDGQLRSAVAGAVLSARLGGCTCEPTITLRRDEYGIVHAYIAHDVDCEHPSQQKGRDA